MTDTLNYHTVSWYFSSQNLFSFNFIRVHHQLFSFISFSLQNCLQFSLSKCRDWPKFISVNLVSVNYVTNKTSENILVYFSFCIIYFYVLVHSTINHSFYSVCFFNHFRSHFSITKQKWITFVHIGLSIYAHTTWETISTCSCLSKQESPADAVKPARRKSMQKLLQFDMFRFISPNSISPNFKLPMHSVVRYVYALVLYGYTQFEIRCLPIIKFLVQITST